MELFNTEYQGEGWYGIRAWSNEINNWEWAEEAPAIWIENEYMFNLETANEANQIVYVATYYGSDELPNEPVAIAEHFIDTLSDEAKAVYYEQQ